MFKVKLKFKSHFEEVHGNWDSQRKYKVLEYKT